MNDIINNAFKHKNGATRYTHIKVGRNESYFTSDPLNGDNKYTTSDISKMIEFLVENMYVRFAGQLFRHTFGIPMGANCAPLLADLFLYPYENEFLDKPIKEGKQKKLAGKFNLSYRYIDEIISFNNKRFNEFISDIYPKELTISETTESTSVASISTHFLPEMRTTALPPNYMTNVMLLVSAWWTFPLCQAIFYQHQPTVSMHLSSFAMPVVVQIIVTCYHTTGPLW